MNAAVPSSVSSSSSAWLNGYRPPPGSYDEMLDRGAVRPAWQPLLRSFDGNGSRLPGQSLGASPPRYSRKRRHLQRPRRPGRHVAAVGTRRPAALGPCRRVDEDFCRPGSAGHAAEHDFGGSLRSAAAALGRIAAARAGVSQSRVSCGPATAYPSLADDTSISTPRTWPATMRAIGWSWPIKARGPTGAGYAIENRIVISRMLPDTFHDCQVERLARFFGDPRDAAKPGTRAGHAADRAAQPRPSQPDLF